MYAIIEAGGKQVKVNEGEIVFLEKLTAEVDEVVTFDKVLMSNGVVGNPYVEGAKVEGVVVKHGKGKKITIFKYVQKQRSTRKKQGHRQPYTKVEIKTIK